LKTLDLNKWNRRQQFNHFKDFFDPYFTLTVALDVTRAYKIAKNNNISFFAKYLHDCMKAINKIENFKYRIINKEVVVCDIINASATIMRQDNTFALTFINYSDDLNEFIKNINLEKKRVKDTNDFYPPSNSLDCIHCSAMPWINFSSNKEAYYGKLDSVPKLAFGKMYDNNGSQSMNVSISVNHALVDGYHVGLFIKYFQEYLNS